MQFDAFLREPAPLRRAVQLRMRSVRCHHTAVDAADGNGKRHLALYAATAALSSDSFDGEHVGARRQRCKIVQSGSRTFAWLLLALMRSFLPERRCG